MLRLLLALWMLLAVSLHAQEKIKLMYLESEHETRAAVLIGRLKPPLEVYRVGIFRVGQHLYGVIRFANANAAGQLSDRHRVGATAALLSDRLFGELPNLVRIDYEGVSKRETKTEKPEVLFSASIDRNTWKTVPKDPPGLDRIAHVGMLYFDPRLELGQPLPKPLVTPAKKKPAKADKAPKSTKKGATRDQRADGELKKP